MTAPITTIRAGAPPLPRPPSTDPRVATAGRIGSITVPGCVACGRFTQRDAGRAGDLGARSCACGCRSLVLVGAGRWTVQAWPVPAAAPVVVPVEVGEVASCVA